MDPLVTTEWLAGELGKPDLAVFDATKYLPNENKDGRAEYLRAHIPGARYFDIDEVADTDTDLPHMVPTPGRFARLMAALGVSNTSRVVFYDQKGLASAARGWWLMGLFGHDHAAVLDGGLPKWMKEGRTVADGEPTAHEPGSFRPDYRVGQLRGVGAPGELVGIQSQGMEVLFELGPDGKRPALLSRATQTGERYRVELKEEELYAALDELKLAEARILSVTQVKATLEEFFMGLVEADRAQAAAVEVHGK